MSGMCSICGMWYVCTFRSKTCTFGPPWPPPGMQGSVFPPHDGMGPPPPRSRPPGGLVAPHSPDDMNFRRGPPPPGDGGHALNNVLSL